MTTAATPDPTGIPNLDLVLGGGVPRGSLVIVVGPPGSGKTTLANQMAFEAARRGRRAMVLTALSEPASKLIAHLRLFRFFDEELVGDDIQFISLQQFLSGGLEATARELVTAARRSDAGFVVLDGLRGVRGASADPQQARQFLYDVGTTLSVLGATTVITTEADPRDPMFFPEATTGDVILGLRYDLMGVRQWRGIEVIKMRGSAPLQGMHGLGLTDEGIVVYPRLESRTAAAVTGSRVGELVFRDVPDGILQESVDLEGRAAFGVSSLDKLLGGGLTRGTSTLLVGGLGTGKTLLSLHFALAGARAGEPTLFLGFRESLRQLLIKTEPFSLGASLREELTPDGNLALMRWAPVEMNPDMVAEQVLATLDRMRARRLVVDSAAELERAVFEGGDPRRVDNYLTALVEAMRLRGITTIFTREVPQASAPELSFAANPISVMAENVLLLRQVERRARLARVLSVIKMRFSPHDTSAIREFTITAPEGIDVLEPSEELAGTTGPVSGPVAERAEAVPEEPRQEGRGGRVTRRNGRGIRDTSTANTDESDEPEEQP